MGFTLMDIKKIKTKLCRVCRVKYTPCRPLQSVCSAECAYKYSKTIRVKAERKETKELKVKLKTKAEWLKEAQAIFNQYIRLRDKDAPCISCQRFHTGQYHAGHYKTTGSHPELRFNEFNVHKQCAPCNNHLSGNIINYRLNLVKKIGLDEVEWLESNHTANKYTIDDIKALKVLYKLKIKALDTNHS